MMKIALWVSQDIKMAYLPNMSGETNHPGTKMLQTGELCDLKLKGNDFSKHHDAMVLASLSDEFAIVKLRQG